MVLCFPGRLLARRNLEMLTNSFLWATLQVLTEPEKAGREKTSNTECVCKDHMLVQALDTGQGQTQWSRKTKESGARKESR